jgi:hypothetical protein
MMVIFRSLSFLAIVHAMAAVAVVGQANGSPTFVERPGVLEFSGQMIVRPLQPDALARQGLQAGEIAAIRRRASDRLADGRACRQPSARRDGERIRRPAHVDR